ncbi:MAG: hypothetical protein E7039_08475 [Lentisphaerae bacterium]|nr:hypothetical protein [Lentisphaerota bacterium]
MDWSFRENWDEYAWSKEIRKDELRIAGYFQTLKDCLDLPGEEDMIFKHLMSQPELVPTGVKDPLRTLKWEMKEMEDEREEDASAEGCITILSPDVMQVERMSVEWNLLAVSEIGISRKVLAVTCAFGKLLSRMYNFEEVIEEPENTALRRSLLKQMLADIDNLESLLHGFNKYIYKKAAGDFVEFFYPLATIREDIINILNEIN